MLFVVRKKESSGTMTQWSMEFLEEFLFLFFIKIEDIIICIGQGKGTST